MVDYTPAIARIVRPALETLASMNEPLAIGWFKRLQEDMQMGHTLSMVRHTFAILSQVETDLRKRNLPEEYNDLLSRRLREDRNSLRIIRAAIIG